jgi:RNA polymerase sigma-70 factor (ECF subfamily)
MLRDALLAEYEGLSKQLALQLGSADFAREALHEAYLRLDRVSDAVAVRSPKAYLFRTAINVARDRRRAGSYRISAAEVDALLDVVDEAPDPARVVEARSEVEALKQALTELTPRQRHIFLAAVVEELPHREIAKRLGIHVRTVQLDLTQALKYCAGRLKRKLTRRFGPGAGETS